MLGNANHFSTLLPKAAQSKTGLGYLKNKETQQVAGMNQAITGHKIKRGDFISESQFYKLAINSEKEQSFAEFSTPCIIPKAPALF